MIKNFLLFTIPVFIWGSTWFVVKLQLGIVDPVVSVAYRFALAALVMFAYAHVTKQLKIRFTPRQHLFIAMQGFTLFFFNYWLFYIGTKALLSALVSICFSTIPMMNIFNQWLFFGIPVKKQVIIGSILGLAGLTFVFSSELSGFHFGDAAFTSLILCMIATYSASLGNIISLRNSRDNMPIVATNSYGMAWGAAFSFIVALATGAPLNFDYSAQYLGALLYLAVLGSAVAFVSYLTLIARIGADRAAYTAILFPVVALCISTFMENYIWTWGAILGLILVGAGNILALSKKKLI